MKSSIRIILALTAIAIILAACAQTADDPTPSLEPSSPPAQSPSETPESTETPEPTETPDASPEPIGIVTIQEGAVVDGPGVPLADALEGDLSQPLLVIGTMVRDADGQLFFTDSVTDAAAPSFGDIRLRVDNYPTDGPTWDMADAEITGLSEANDVRFFQDAKFYALIVLDQ